MKFHIPVLSPKEEKEEQGNKKTTKKLSMDKLLLILLAGITLVILSIPNGEKKSEKTKEEIIKEPENIITVTNDTYEKLLEDRLMELLSNVEGVGKTKVMITIKSTGEKVILKERPYSKSISSETDSEGGKRDTEEITQSEVVVYIEGSDGSKTPYVIKETEPQIEGIAVIAEGGDNIYIIKDIKEAVAALFDVPSHKIKVMKMKNIS